MQKNLLLQEFEDLKRASILLKESIKKFNPYKIEKKYTPDELEYYDSLSFRFEKSVELILTFFKGLELFLYSKVSDTLRDRLLIMQKLNMVDAIDFWMEARLLRNKIAHTYVPEELKDIYNEIFEKSQVILKSIEPIEKYLTKIIAQYSHNEE